MRQLQVLTDPAYDAMVPRQFLRDRWPTESEMEAGAFVPLPVASNVVDVASLDNLPTNATVFAPGVVYNVRDSDPDVFAFGYGVTTNTAGKVLPVICRLELQESTYRYLLVFLPVTVGLDAVLFIGQAWMYSQSDCDCWPGWEHYERSDHHKHHHHHPKPPHPS